MIDLLKNKVKSGDLHIESARHYLQIHEWGLARKTLLEGLAKGNLSRPRQATDLFSEIEKRLGINRSGTLAP